MNTHETKNKLLINFISRVPCPGYFVYHVELTNKNKHKSIEYDLTKLRSRNGSLIISDILGQYTLLQTGIIESQSTINGYIAMQPTVLATNRPLFYFDSAKIQVRTKKQPKTKNKGGGL